MKKFYKDDFLSRYSVSVHNNKFKGYEKHSHNFYEFEYITDGCAECVIDNQKYTVEKNDLVFVSPINVHSYEGIGGQIQTITVHFTGEILQNSFGIEKLRGCVIKDVQSFKNYFECIFSEYSNIDSYSYWGIANIIERIVIEFLRAYNIVNENELTDKQKIEGYILTNFKENINLEKVSSYFGYSTTYFSRLFRSMVGINFNEYINNCRLDYAHSLLEMTDMFVVDVCYAAGYNSVRTFTRNFKKKYGVSPSEMKK